MKSLSTAAFSSPSHHGIVQHFQKLHRTGAAGERIARQLLHIGGIRGPCHLGGPADRALDRLWVALLPVSNGHINILLHGLQTVLLLTDQLQALLQDAVGAHVAGNAHRAQQVVDMGG